MPEMMCVRCCQDVLKDAVESNMQSATAMPYFEGDFWPNILEESIKELEEEEDKRRREEMEAAATSAADIEELTTEKEDAGEVCSSSSRLVGSGSSFYLLSLSRLSTFLSPDLFSRYSLVAPLALWPCGVHCSACLGILPSFLLKVCQSHYHFLFRICSSTGS